jgi:adenylyl cyclase-associated protein
MSDTLALLQTIVSRLDAIEAKLGSAPSSSSSSGSSSSSAGDDHPAIRAYDAYCRENLEPFLAAARELGGGAEVASSFVERGWNKQREFLVKATQAKKPSMPDRQAALADITTIIGEASRAIERDDWENHYKAVSEGIQCLTWLLVEPAPRDFIENFIGGSDFWANKIRVAYRKTEPKQIAFCDTFKTLISELIPFVKDHHMTGVTWNANGVDLSSLSSSSSSSEEEESKASSSQPTAESKIFSSSSSSSSENEGNRSQLFAALSKGTSITGGLKKVTKDQQTWRSEYKGGDAPAPQAKKPVARRPTEQVKGTPKFEYQAAGKRWIIEYQSADAGVLTVNIENLNQSVYIFGCLNATIDIQGKCKGIVVDSCKKTQVLFDDIVSSFELVNCQRMQAQSRGVLPSLSIDKTDGCLVYLSEQSINSPIVSSKSSEMNIAFQNAEGEMIEMPIPEQFVHHVDLSGSSPSISSEVSELYS